MTLLVPLMSPMLAFLEAASPAEVRALRSFVEAEIRLPDGPRKGDLFDGTYPRWQGMLLEMLADPFWREVWMTGPRQTGKTLLGFEAPLLHALFELREDVICLVPEMKKAEMIWRKKIEPVLRRSKYADLMPKHGAGSRGGGAFDLMLFENGCSMHFMGAGGADPPSSATARVVVITEANEMRISPTGDQGNPIDAVRGCTASFADTARIHGESIITTPDCITWKQITEIGTDTRVMLRCPHCFRYHYPERERLVGWKDAPDALAAGAAARYVCECGVRWDETDRARAIEDARLVHRGQEVDADGNVTGPMPRTRVLGVRWNAMCHPLRRMADIAEAEWNARKLNLESKEMELCQYFWAVPYVPKLAIEEISLEGLAAVSQRGKLGKATVPDWVEFLTLTVDVQNDRHYWLVMGHGPEDRWCIVDWGFVELVPKHERQPTPEDRRRAQETIEAMAAQGWQVEGGGQRMSPVAKGEDVGYLTSELVGWIRGHADWFAMRGVGRDDIKGTGTKDELPEHLTTWLEVSRPAGWTIDLLRVNAHNVRTEVHAGLLREPGSAASGEIPRGLKGNDYLLMHLSGEVWDTSPAKKGKKPYWREVRIRHDLLDCAVYGLALGRYHRELLASKPVVVSLSGWGGKKGRR